MSMFDEKIKGNFKCRKVSLLASLKLTLFFLKK